MVTKEDELLTATAVTVATGVPSITIKRWAKAGLVVCRCDSAGRRIYGRESIAQIKALRDRKAHVLPERDK